MAISEMNNGKVDSQEAANEVYEYAASLLVHEGKSPEEAKALLVQRGLSRETAGLIIDELLVEISKAKKGAGQKDMLYGALWCVGGLVGTFANIGFIFWGAIVFGAFQFIRGMVTYSSN
ncbi:MAG TPA: hypothetical protein ENJ82_16350 [Bacteroidetes bacterium]|nr:hypothetical protein [Bacteroidota bacterium]